MNFPITAGLVAGVRNIQTLQADCSAYGHEDKAHHAAGQAPIVCAE